MNKKNKFIENNDNKLNKQPYYEQKNNDNCIQNIIKDNYTSKNKCRLELTNNLNPFNYDLNYENKIKKDVKGDNMFIYYSPYNQGPGRGFGNLNINNQIRKSESSRNDNEDFKLFRESEIINRFDFLDNRYSNPSNVVFPFPRSGETTRNKVEKSLNNSQNINHYNFNQPNKIKLNNLSNKINIDNLSNKINIDNLPNKQLIDKINYNNNQQKIRQQNHKIELNELQNKINELKIKYGDSLTREIIIKELNLKKDPTIDDFLQIPIDYSYKVPDYYSNKSNNPISESNNPINNFSNNPINESNNPINNFSNNPINESNNPINKSNNYSNNFSNNPINNYSNNPINNYSNNPINNYSNNPINNYSNNPINESNNSINESNNYSNNPINESNNYSNNPINESNNYSNNFLNNSINESNNPINNFLNNPINNFSNNSINESNNYSNNFLNNPISESNNYSNNFSNNLYTLGDSSLLPSKLYNYSI
jgi:hypothetical protein